MTRAQRIEEAARRAADLLRFTAQNDYMIDGHYTVDGAAMTALAASLDSALAAPEDEGDVVERLRSELDHIDSPDWKEADASERLAYLRQAILREVGR